MCTLLFKSEHAPEQYPKIMLVLDGWNIYPAYNIHNQNVAELVHYIIIFCTQGLGTYFGDTGILVWHLFFRTFEATASQINLESNWQPRYSAVLCCLMEWPTKDILISFKPLVFEKRMDLVLSSPK